MKKLLSFPNAFVWSSSRTLAVARNPNKRLKVLITCGATWVALDDVRVISNISSGEMGHAIAGAFQRRGALVTLLEGPVTCRQQGKGIKTIKYRFLDELDAALKGELDKKYDIVMHAAAVSDFRPRVQAKKKISSARAITLDLVPAPKLIDKIKRLNPETCLVGFKLESSLDEKALFKTTRLLFTQSGCDLVVANTLKGGYRGFIVDADGRILAKARNKQKIAFYLAGLLT